MSWWNNWWGTPSNVYLTTPAPIFQPAVVSPPAEVRPPFAQLIDIGTQTNVTTPASAPPTSVAPTPFSLQGADPKLNLYQNEQAMRQAGTLPRVMPTPSAYQVGLYRHMIWKILQADDPVLMEQLQTRLTPQGLFNALTYLRENQLDALSGPQNDPLFNSDPARLGVVVDDIAVWLSELDARQRAKIAAAVAAKTGASVLPVMADSTQILLGLLLVAGGFGAMWFVRRNKEQRNF